MQKFTPEDLFLHQKATEIHAAPGRDGTGVAAATVRSARRQDNCYVSCIWEFHSDATPPRQLTRGPGLDSSPRLSADGKRLAFLSDRSGTVQIYVLELAGGEARQLGHFPLGAGPCRWTPDGSMLLTTAPVAVNPDVQGRRGEPSPQRKDHEPEVCWRLPYKSDGTGYLLGRESHLFGVDLSSGESTQLTDGAFDVMGCDPSPNGRHVAYSRSRSGRFAHCTDLWVCGRDGAGHRRLTTKLATVMQPAWSPDGSRIAFAGAAKEGDGRSRLWVLEYASGHLAPAGPDDLEVADPLSLSWAADSRSIVIVRAHRGRHEVISVGVTGDELSVLQDGDRQFGAFAAAGEHFFFSVETPLLPSEVSASWRDGSDEVQVSDLNPWWRERTPLEMEARHFSAPDGLGGTETIEGWLLRAKGTPKPMPLLSDVHGGPGAYALLDFDTNVFWQVLCSNGWSVLMLNPVGSSSFGDEFCTRLAGHWGEYDLPQHRAALRQLRAEGVCDSRLAIAGKSYGGYFAAWAIGHCHEFRAAVVMAPVGNIETHYGTSDGGYYADPLYLGTAPGFDRGRARELSPLQFIEQATTPTLFMQGKDDERCPKCQSEELFVSLYRAGETPAELVLYPGEDHHFLGEGKPECRADAVTRVVDWVSSHIARPRVQALQRTGRATESRTTPTPAEAHESTPG
jgi:dipeptidyl aminopeptidase/acylaminoacyl peptidase